MAADSRFYSERPPMFVHSATIPGETLFEYLSNDGLESVDSNEERSIYRYNCGCTVLRLVPGGQCAVTWCVKHNSFPNRAD